MPFDLPIYSIIGIIAGILLLLICITGYVKAPPDQVFVISGLRRRAIIGKAGIRIPFLERLDILSLRMMSVDVKTNSYVPTAEYINITVDAAVKLKIGTDHAMVTVAAQNFLNQKSEYVIGQVQDVLEGNMREIIGQMRLEEMVTNRKAFAEKVQENAVPDLRRMGLEIISFNVQSFSDQNGVINDLGIDNISQIKKKAAIAKAEADKEIAKAQAQAGREANDARIDAETQIAIRNNELLIREAELRNEADIKKAEADAAYSIQQEEQRKTIEIKTVDANIAKQEREAILKAKEVEVMERSLEATVRKKADADLYERQKVAEAELFERQKQAEGIRALGLAEAEAIKAKAIAEAEGINRKAEAMRKYGEAAILEMYFAALPEIAKNVADPLSKVDHITMYGDGNSAKLIQDIVNSTTQISEGFTQGMGIDLKAVLAGFMGGRLGAGTAEPKATPKTDK